MESNDEPAESLELEPVRTGERNGPLFDAAGRLYAEDSPRAGSVSTSVDVAEPVPAPTRPSFPVDATQLVSGLREFLNDAVQLIERERPLTDVLHLTRWGAEGSSSTVRTELAIPEAMQLVEKANLASAARVAEVVDRDPALRAALMQQAPGNTPELRAWQRVIGPALSAFLRLAQDANENTPLETALGMVTLELHTGLSRVTERRPLALVRLTDTTKLSDKSRLRRPTGRELERWLPRLPTFALFGVMAVLETDYSVEIWNREMTEHRRVSDRSDRLVTAIQLVTNCDVRWVCAETGLAGVFGHTAGFRSPAPSAHPHRRSPTLTHETTPILLRLVDALERPLTPSIDLALRRWADVTRRGRPDERLIDEWIALEALFTGGDSSETSYRSALRIAAYVARNGEEARTIYRDVKKSYGDRSRLVHGAHVKGDMEPMAERTREWLRRALIRALLDPGTLDPDETEPNLLAFSPDRSQDFAGLSDGDDV